MSVNQAPPTSRSQIATHRHTMRRSSSFDDLDQVRQQNSLEAQHAFENVFGAHRMPNTVPLRRRHSSETPRASMDLAQSAHARLIHDLANELHDELELDHSTAVTSESDPAKEMPAVIEHEKQEPPSE